MARFANGKFAYGISDRSGFRYKLNEMKREWTGMLVGPDEYEPKQPQLEPRRKAVDPQALLNPRPQPNNPTSAFLVKTTNGISYLGNGNWTTSGVAQLPSELDATDALTGSVGSVTVTTS